MIIVWLQASIRILDWLGDITLVTLYGPVVSSLLSCRLDSSVVGSRTGPWRLEQRAAKLAYWLHHGLRRSWRVVAAMQWADWRVVVGRDGVRRVVVMPLEGGQEVTVDGLEEEEGDGGNEGE